MKAKPEKKPKLPMDPISREIRKYERRAANIAQKIAEAKKQHENVVADLKEEGAGADAVLDALRKNQKAMETGRAVLEKAKGL